MLLLTDPGLLQEIEHKFFIKGHTKNSCDRWLGFVQKLYNRNDCWTMNHIIDVAAFSTGNEAMELSNTEPPIRDYKKQLVTGLLC